LLTAPLFADSIHSRKETRPLKGRVSFLRRLTSRTPRRMEAVFKPFVCVFRSHSKP